LLNEERFLVECFGVLAGCIGHLAAQV
jgi:hypothetical protein